MTLPPASSDRILRIHLSLTQYPILSSLIRARMRREIFNRGIKSAEVFEAEVREKAIQSQTLEGLTDPFAEEPADIWEMRKASIRDHLTDFYFAYNLPYDQFEQIVRETLTERGSQPGDYQISFNPELAPQNMLFEQAMAIERMPAEERHHANARLQEIKVVLIRTLISDQLGYLKIAKEWFTISDLKQIRSRKIGQGKIGGKSAGMLLAYRILQEKVVEEIRDCIHIPESYYIGADLTYTFMALNGLMKWSDQKYKLEDQIREEYPKLQAEFLKGNFPPDILDRFRELLEEVNNKPLIVRSSSLLEDNFGTSFAGKYDSYYCPNNQTLEENLHDLTQAIQRIYASILNPDALIYRRAKGLQDYDERMAILIQVVEGELYKQFYLPHASGVAFSRNLYRWSPQIHKEVGFMRLVWGLGTRAVDRVGDDYPRLVALSHPLLHPESSTEEIQKYSQKFVDLLDLEDNQFKTLPIKDVLAPDYPLLRYLVQIDQGDYLTPIRTRLEAKNVEKFVLTCDELLRRTPLASYMANILPILEKHYHTPVDTEFTCQVIDPSSQQPDIRITILQCRPQSHLTESEARIPHNLDDQDIIFASSRMAPQGRIKDIQYVSFVPPEEYYSLKTTNQRANLAKVIGRLNSALSGVTFICVGPGRWGTVNPDLGVPVGYGDIYNTRALIELAGEGIGSAPEASFGTHFFQDLMESNIYPLAIYLDDKDVVFSRRFFYNTPNRLSQFIPEADNWNRYLRVIEVATFRPENHIDIIMDDEQGRTVAFLQHD